MSEYKCAALECDSPALPGKAWCKSCWETGERVRADFEAWKRTRSAKPSYVREEITREQQTQYEVEADRE